MWFKTNQRFNILSEFVLAVVGIIVEQHTWSSVVQLGSKTISVLWKVISNLSVCQVECLTVNIQKIGHYNPYKSSVSTVVQKSWWEMIEMQIIEVTKR